MNKFLPVFLTLLLFFLGANAQTWPFGFSKPKCSNMPGAGSNCTKWPVVNNGQWDNASTWNGGTLPKHKDIVCIPANWKVEVQGATYTEEGNGQCLTDTLARPTLYLFICGTLSFKPSGKLYLGCGSVITIYPGTSPNGTVTANGSNSSSDLIKIGPTLVWGGAGSGNQPDLVGPYYVTGPGQGPGLLASGLSNFRADLTSNNQVTLTWNATSENGNSDYIVQKSINKNEWITVGKLKATGNNNNLAFTDKSPVAGTNYYRVAELNTGGELTYSNVIPVTLNSKLKISVYPNPVVHSATLFLPDNFNTRQSIQVFSMNGTLVETINGFSGNTLHLSTEKWKAGTYMIRITEEGLLKAQTSLIKQ